MDAAGVLTATWSLPVAISVFVASALAITVAGTRLAGVADRLADRTGLGEAITGALLLGAATSLPGIVVSVVGATAGEPSLAVSNSVGGIAVQTAFVVVLDLVYGRPNLEHAAASLTNLFNSLLMMTLLGITLVGVAAPPVTVWEVHPATMLLLVVYLYGVRVSRQVSAKPMWQPEETDDTDLDVPDEPEVGESMAGLAVRFGALTLVVGIAGWGVGRAGISFMEATGISGTVVAVVFTSVATSLPELVTGIAAVRRGAPTLAVAGIIGGNTFDTLFIAVSDVAYREGSIYAAVEQQDLFAIGWAMLLTGILGAGLLRRQRIGIGFEGGSIMVLYVLGLLVLTRIG